MEEELYLFIYLFIIIYLFILCISELLGFFNDEAIFSIAYIIYYFK